MPDEELLNEFVDRYLQKQIHQAQTAGMSPQSIEDSMEIPSFILSVKMLRNYLTTELPGGEEVVETLALLMQETPAQARNILERFVQRGWLTSDYLLTGAGLKLVGHD